MWKYFQASEDDAEVSLGSRFWDISNLEKRIVRLLVDNDRREEGEERGVSLNWRSMWAAECEQINDQPDDKPSLLGGGRIASLNCV